MTSGIRASIIIPAYNAQRFIAGAITSARAQTLRDIEIIVVDDGSRDGTTTAALDAAGNDPRVRVICYEMNRGAAHARNVALAAASGGQASGRRSTRPAGGVRPGRRRRGRIYRPA